MTPERKIQLQEFAENLCAAYLSNQMGLSLAYAKQAYVKDSVELGEYWYVLAERVLYETTK